MKKLGSTEDVRQSSVDLRQCSTSPTTPDTCTSLFSSLEHSSSLVLSVRSVDSCSGQVPLVQILVEGTPVHALLDSGSSVSIVSQPVYDALSSASPPTLHTRGLPVVHGVTGQPVSILGSALICSLSMGGHTVQHTLLVATGILT